MLGRRQFLGFLGAAPIVGPAVAKQAVEAIGAEIANLSTSTVPSAPVAGEIWQEDVNTLKIRVDGVTKTIVLD